MPPDICLRVIGEGDFLVSSQVTQRVRGFSYELCGDVSHELRSALDYYIEMYCAKKPAPLPTCRLPVVSPFTGRCLKVLSELAFGQTLSYAELACVLGAPRAFRAVGSACSKNPLPFFLPCHRVVSQKGLGGYTPDIEVKKSLLFFETGIQFAS